MEEKIICHTCAHFIKRKNDASIFNSVRRYCSFHNYLVVNEKSYKCEEWKSIEEYKIANKDW